MDQALGPLSIFGSVILGIALLWSVRLAYGNRRENSDDTLRLVLTIGGWTLYGLFGHIALLPLCVLLDTPMWLMAGFPMVPLLLNVAVTRNDLALESSAGAPGSPYTRMPKP